MLPAAACVCCESRHSTSDCIQVKFMWLETKHFPHVASELGLAVRDAKHACNDGGETEQEPVCAGSPQVWLASLFDRTMTCLLPCSRSLSSALTWLMGTDSDVGRSAGEEGQVCGVF